MSSPADSFSGNLEAGVSYRQKQSDALWEDFSLVLVVMHM